MCTGNVTGDKDVKTSPKTPGVVSLGTFATYAG